MIYSTVEEMMNAGIENMAVLVDNTAYDDNSYMAAGADWLYFNGVQVQNVYVSGNSYFGLGASNEHLKVNRIDAKMWYLYREECQIGGTKCLKFRWKGYSRYNQTSDSYLLIYDVVLFDNGNIYVHMDTIPTQYFDGTFSLTAGTTYSYTVNENQRDVLFTFNPENNSYTVSYEMPFILTGKYLIRKNGEIFTRIDGTIQSIGQLAVNSALFEDHGVYSIFTTEELTPLEFPEILFWTPEEPTSSPALTVTARPVDNQQIITDAIDLTHETIKGIESVIVDCDGDLLMAVSFDEKQTWKAWNGTDWVNLDSQFSGMSKEILETITVDQWAQMYEGSTNMFIRLSFVNVNQIVRQIYIDFLN